MIFTDEQKKEYIREIQYYLFSIASYNEAIPKLIPDGIYNESTRKAVIAFQAFYQLPQTGEIDKKTWDTIVAVYKDIFVYIPESINIFPSIDYVVEPGCTHPYCDKHLVSTIQLMLIAISEKFDEIPMPGINGVYDAPTIESVKKIQELSLNPVTGKTDKYTWNAIVKLFNYIQQKKAVPINAPRNNNFDDNFKIVPAAI